MAMELSSKTIYMVRQPQTHIKHPPALALALPLIVLIVSFSPGMGRDGGAEAAHRLNIEVQTYLKSALPDANVDDWSVVCQVILNQQGLANKLQNCGIIMSPNELSAFGRAFALAQPLFSFVDVGAGKERVGKDARQNGNRDD